MKEINLACELLYNQPEPAFSKTHDQTAADLRPRIRPGGASGRTNRYDRPSSFASNGDLGHDPGRDVAAAYTTDHYNHASLAHHVTPVLVDKNIALPLGEGSQVHAWCRRVGVSVRPFKESGNDLTADCGSESAYEG